MHVSGLTPFLRLAEAGSRNSAKRNLFQIWTRMWTSPDLKKNLFRRVPTSEFRQSKEWRYVHERPLVMCLSPSVNAIHTSSLTPTSRSLRWAAAESAMSSGANSARRHGGQTRQRVRQGGSHQLSLTCRVDATRERPTGVSSEMEASLSSPSTSPGTSIG